MTERGLPIADGAPACPFVAFEDDRDERATSPDHRHRCYAEANPAPRALAHQEAYCLSSAFPVCPTFQDWARREAARSRADRPRPSESTAAEIAADSSHRNPPRNWAAPPPWSGRGGGGSGGLWEDADSEDAEMGDDVPRRGRGLSGSYADRVAADAGPAIPGGLPLEDAPDLDDEPAAGIAAPTPADHDPWDVEQADLTAEGGAVAGANRRRERDSSRVAAFAGDGEPHRAPAHPASPERQRERRRDPGAPEWESGRPAEVYPTLRSRRLPELSVPPVLVGVIALALAAAVLFALPGLLGFGNPGAVATPTPTAGASIAASLPPTPVPPPTPQIYIVQSGDTMSRIASRFEIPLDELIAANEATIPDPDELQIGDQVIIPVPQPSEIPAASQAPAAS